MAKNVTWQQYQKQIQELATLDFNYDEKMYHAAKDKRGWFVDRYEATLAIEPEGPPLQNGAFAAVKQTIQLYQFANPKLIYAFFDPEQPLLGRNMLMFAHFSGFTFQFGVRVVAVTEEVRKNKLGEDLQVWGYAYRTLKGHFEIGEIRFEVTKNLKTGEVAIDISAYSKPDRIPNFFFRSGFKLFGRSLQKYFAHSSIRRLQKVAKTALRHNVVS